MPFAFTEHGVGMLSSVLHSDKAVDMNIAIIRAFIALKQLAIEYGGITEKLQEFKKELSQRLDEHDAQLNNIYDALENMLDKQTEEKITQKKWEERERIGFKK